jgi:hypothetical protein
MYDLNFREMLEESNSEAIDIWFPGKKISSYPADNPGLAF